MPQSTRLTEKLADLERSVKHALSGDFPYREPLLKIIEQRLGEIPDTPDADISTLGNLFGLRGLLRQSLGLPPW